jgi:hypothetical protein
MSRFLLIGLLGLIALPAAADFHGRFPATPGGTDYQAYYDDQLDITWAADANWGLAQGLRDKRGLLTGEVKWQDTLDAIAAYSLGGESGWRLPRTSLTVDCGEAITSRETCLEYNELGHLYFYGAGMDKGVTGVTAATPGPFANVTGALRYWTGTACESGSSTCSILFYYWTNSPGQLALTGNQDAGTASSHAHVWPVFDGDIYDAQTEICDNGIDDDLDGLIDDADSDCQTPPPPELELCGNGIDDDGDGEIDEGCPVEEPPVADLYVRCLHKPLYAKAGETVTITAAAMNRESEPVDVDRIEIYIGQSSGYTTQRVGASTVTHTLVADDSNFSYGCRAEMLADGNQPARSFHTWGDDGLLREVDTGQRGTNRFPAIPVVLNRSLDQGIDIVLLADDINLIPEDWPGYLPPEHPDYPAYDTKGYDGYDDPDFLDAVYALVFDGLYTIPWYAEHQDYINIWIGLADDADASERPSGYCNRIRPSDHAENYGFAAAMGIIHRVGCRDNANAGQRAFTSSSFESEPNRLQVIGHEIAHAPFGLSDEYCCDGGYFQRGHLPNVYLGENECLADAPSRLFDAEDCRHITTTVKRKDGVITIKDWYIGEPEFRLESDPDWHNLTRDLMQQTGKRCIGDETLPNNGTYKTCVDSYQVGNSEIERMTWYLGKCDNGEC